MSYTDLLKVRIPDGTDIYLEQGDGQFEGVKAALSEMVDKLAAVVTDARKGSCGLEVPVKIKEGARGLAL